MDSFEWNKIAGGVLAAALLVLVIRIGTESLFHHEALATNAYPIAVEQSEAPVAAAAEPEGPSLAELLAAATPEQGQAVFKKCATCHNAALGAGNKVGPNLYGIVGHDIAATAGFGYSAGLSAIDGVWDFAALDQFLTKPNDFAKGTKMSFAGLNRPEDRARVIAYLNAQSDAPLALPEVAVEEAPAPAEEAVQP